MSDQDSVESMKERKIRLLTQKNEERKQKLEKRKESKAMQSLQEENINCVLDKFEQLEKEIISCLTQIEDANVPKESLPELFDSSYCKLEEWQKMISLTSHILRIYHKKQFQVKYQEMNDKRLKLEQSLIPQKKFSFTKLRSKNAKNETGDKELFPSNVQDEPDATPVIEKPAKKYVLKLDDEFGFFQRENENLMLKHEEVFLKDVTFRDLKSCQIRIDGGANTVHFVSLTDCLILCGPVSTSIFVDKCTNCTFVVACQQLRVHHTFDTKFYVHVTSRAIIEDCKTVYFAPYNWNYDGIDEHFQKVNLDKAVNNWNLVNDFNWLSSVPSPNWKIIEENERKTEWS
ncbi:tubulin-specific chaperone C-like [Planococcus citri]|uniref:tubulin-specific chaperone C-like n=1 Tax=Planococcus citri TaxID=170843 RepID=UPI0031F8BF8B